MNKNKYQKMEKLGGVVSARQIEGVGRREIKKSGVISNHPRHALGEVEPI